MAMPCDGCSQGQQSPCRPEVNQQQQQQQDFLQLNIKSIIAAAIHVTPALLTKTESTSPVTAVTSASVQQSRPPCMGQPTPWTHPHLLRSNEIAVGITQAEFQQRRRQLMTNIQTYARSLKESLHHHIVVIPSATKKYMTDKIPYVFRQNSDFYYLTGCLEPDSALVMWIDAAGVCKSAMAMRPKDAHAELWDGPRTGAANAVTYFGVDEAFSTKELRAFLTK